MSRIGKACNLCRSKKRRCTGGDPCRRCFLAKAECLYGQSTKKIKAEEDIQINIASGSTEELFKEIETVIPLNEPQDNSLSIPSNVKTVSPEIVAIVQKLDRSLLISNVTKFLKCGYISYDVEAMELKFGTDKEIKSEDITALVLIVLALGFLYKSDLNAEDFEVAMKLYHGCSSLISLFHENISLENVEVMALNSWFLRAINEQKSSMVISSMSIQIASMMGLHKLAADDDDDMLERKKKVWWTAYSINRFFSVRSGVPVYLCMKHITSPYPKHEELLPHHRIYNDKTYDLAMIAEDINKFYLNRESCSTSIVDKIMNMIQRLIKWKDTIPLYSPDALSRSLSSLNLNHSHLIQLTTIPVLLHLTIQRLSGYRVDITSLTSRMVSIISICQKSALLSINIFTHMSKDSIANFGVFDIEYLSTSSLIICMVTVLNMNSDTSDTLGDAISLLEHIKTFGSPHANENHSKLVEFLNETRTFVNKNKSVSSFSPSSIQTYSIPQDKYKDDLGDDSQLWEQIYHDVSLDMNSNWEEFINFL